MRDEMKANAGDKEYDLVVTSNLSISRYAKRKRKWRAPIDKKLIPNLKHIDSKWLKAFLKVEGSDQKMTD